jgi:hypothetical protein
MVGCVCALCFTWAWRGTAPHGAHVHAERPLLQVSLYWLKQAGSCSLHIHLAARQALAAAEQQSRSCHPKRSSILANESLAAYESLLSCGVWRHPARVGLMAWGGEAAPAARPITRIIHLPTGRILNN